MPKLQEGETIDLNTATAEEVASIPNIGMQSARSFVAARPESGFRSWDQVVKQVSGWGPFTVELAEPYCMFGPSSEPEQGEDIEDPDEVEEPEEPQEHEPAPKARRRKRTQPAKVGG
jgi:Helix-hairpin-helix motif